MKIGIFSDTYYPQINGVATSVLLLKEYLEKKGHEVYVFTTTDPKAPVHEERVARYPSIPFSNTGRRIAAVLYPAIERAFKRNDFDIIHTHTEFSIGILGRRLARSLEIPHVHTMHTIYEDYTHYIARWKVLTPVNRALARKYTASFCNSADRVIVPTEKTKELLLSYGVSRKIEVIPTGLRLERFAKSAWKPEEVEKAREGLGLGKNDMAVIYIGRVSKEKNLDEIVSAMAAYLPFHQDVKLVLVGDGPERKKLESLAGELGILNQVIFAGERPWEEIGLYYNVGYVFVSASTSETQGLTYIEALAAGLPLVVREDPCLRNVVQDGVNGYTFKDRNEFISRLDSVLKDPEHRKKLSLEAEKSAKKFSVEHFGETVLGLYSALLSERSQAGEETVRVD